VRAVIALLVLIGIPAPARTAGPDRIHLSPTTVTIAATESAGSVVVRNDGTRTMSFTVEAFGWRNSPAHEVVLNRTDDLIVYPVRVDIAPGTVRRIRIGTRVKADTTERSYRLILEQVPDAAVTPGAISMRARYSLPVFVQPRTRTATVTLTDVGLGAGELRLTLQNRGLVHVTPRTLSAVGKDAGGRIVWTRALSTWYLLAGDLRTYRGTVSAAECHRTTSVEAEATFLEGAALTVRRTHTIGRGSCGQP
jgi:fimbrial chaperone protein